MRNKLATVDLLIARIAANQHGVISSAQLVGAGLTRTAIRRRVEAGRLHRVHRGVYAVGHTRLSEEGRFMAAVLACGDRAVLSHESAAKLWRLSPTCPQFVHVTVPGDAGRAKREGMVFHRSRTLTPRDVTRRHNIPVTKPARTRRDLGWDASPTRSDIERDFLRAIKKHGIPKPGTNVPIRPYTVDFLWRAESLVVELDSYAYHSDRPTFTSDRKRDRFLKARGLEVHRYSDDELDDDPDAVALSLLELLRRRRLAA